MTFCSTLRPAVPVLALLLSACSVTEPTPSASPNDTSDGGPSRCTALSEEGGRITLAVEPRDAPAPLGGSIDDGTYVLTSGSFFTGPGGESGTGDERSMTLRVTGSVMEAVRTEGGSRHSIRTDGTTLHTVQTCPKDDEETMAYTATPRSLTLFVHDDDGTIVLAFEKRP